MKNKPSTGAIFLDRDGVLIKRPHPTWKKSQLELQSGAAGFVHFLNTRNIPVVVITNQAVVARGLISEAGVSKLHDSIQKNLERKGSFINRFYFCPHHREATLSKYRKKCSCRKPEIGLYKKAKKDLKINFRKSFTIGDMTQDILAGDRAGVTTILLKKGHQGKDGKYKVTPDYEAKNFKEVLKILKNHGIK